MKICQFLKENNLIKRKLNLNVTYDPKGRKQYGLPKGYPEFTQEQIDNHNDNKRDFNSAWIYLKNTGFVVLDCDDKKSIEFIESLKLNTPYTETTKGRHYYIKCDEDIPRALKVNGELDIISEYICESYNRNMCKVGKIATLTKSQLYEKLQYTPPIANIKTIKNIESKFSGDIPISMDTDIDIIDKETLFKIVDNLNVSNFENIKDWKKFMFAMINQSKGGDSMEYFNKAVEFLKSLKNFDFQENYNFWNQYKDSSIVHPAKLFYDWLKRDNKALYDKLILFVNKNFDKDEFKKKKTYEDKKIYFEKYTFKVLVSGSPIFFMNDLDKHDFKEYNETGIRTTFKHLKIETEGKKKHFMDLWTDDEDIRLYDNIDFTPPPAKLFKNTYNLYNGLRAEKDLQDISTGNIDRILKHIFYLCGENQTNADYMLDMMASKVKYPGKLPGVGIILKSIQGVGKNLLADFFGNHILGARYYLCDSNADTFLGRFGCGLKNKLLCVMNEVSGKDTFGKDGILKGYITDEKIRYEAKNINHIFVNNFAMIWFFTNNENPLPIEPTDRRLVAFECSSVQRTIPNYFEDLVKDMKDEIVQKGFYDYLMNRDIEDDYNFEKNRPVTETYKTMKQNSIPVMIRFFKWYSEENFQDENIKSKDFWNKYQEFLTETKTKCEMNANKFGVDLRKYKDIIKREQINNRTIYNIVWNKFINKIEKYYE